MRHYLALLLWCLVMPSLWAQIPHEQAPQNVLVYVVPIEGPIAGPQTFILRRALKEAIEENVKTVVLKIDTPGGAVNDALEIIEMLEKFPGTTLAFVDNEALSAGAYIAIACDKIYMTPNGLIGSAAVVQATGQDVPETVRLKIESYLKAKIRQLSENDRYRGPVMQAMMDKAFVLEIEGKTLKPKGELLTLTASEANALYGAPPQPLLASGVASSTQAMLEQYFQKNNFVIKNFEITWSEALAKWLQGIAPVLLGLGMLCLFIEFKTPGFGVFGMLGLAALLIVFASNYVAGLAGNEEILIFLVGLLLLAAEIFLIPGTMIAGASGILMILGALVWAMADIWPSESFKITPDIFVEPLINVALALIFGLLAAILLSRFIPKSSLWKKLVLKAQVRSTKPQQNGDNTNNLFQLPPIGTRGYAATDLFPSGEIDIGGKRYQACSELGMIQKNSEVIVSGYKNFAVTVKPLRE